MKIGQKEIKKIIDQDTQNPVGSVSFEVMGSGAFQYGNQTCTVVTIAGSDAMCYDTRYFTGTLKEFIRQWAEDYLKKGLILA